MFLGSKVEPIKKVFNNNEFKVGYPYMIFRGNSAISGVFEKGTETELLFNYFNDEGQAKQIVFTCKDEVEIYEIKSTLFMDTETANAVNTMRAIHNWANNETPESEPNVDDDVETETDPDPKMFWIKDMSTSDTTRVPLFVRENGDLIINYKYLEKFLYDDNTVFSIRYGVKSSGFTGASDSFDSKNVQIHVGGTALTGKILDENRDVVRLIEVRSDDWRQLAFAQVRLYRKKKGTK